MRRTRWQFFCALALALVAAMTADTPSATDGQTPLASDGGTRVTAPWGITNKLDLDALIAEVNPPSLEDVLSWFEPFPTPAEALAPISRAGDGPARQSLTPPERARAEELEQRIDTLCKSGDFASAVPAAEELLRLRRQRQGADHWQTVDARHSARLLVQIAGYPSEVRAEIATTYRTTERASALRADHRPFDARPLFEQALAIRWQVLGTDNSATVDSLHDLVDILNRCGRKPEAERASRAALALRRRLVGMDHPAIARWLHTEGRVLRASEHEWAAPRCGAASVVMLRRILGNESPEVSTGLWSLGETLLGMSDYPQAEATYRSLLESERRRLGPEDPGLVDELNNLALAISDQGRHREGETLLREALALAGRQPTECRTYAVLLGNLARMLLPQGEFVEAEQAAREALRIQRRLYGDCHRNVGAGLRRLARIASELGDHAQAERWYREELAIHNALALTEHPRNVRTLHNLANTLLAQGKLSAAEQACGDALRIRRRCVRDAHVDIGGLLHQLARIKHAQGDCERAIGLAREALSVYEMLPGHDPRLRIAALTTLGHYLASSDDESDYAEAEEILSAAVALARDHRVHEIQVPCTVYGDFLLHRRHEPTAALPLYREAIEHIEQNRSCAGSDALDCSRYFSVLSRTDSYGGRIRAQLAPPGDESTAATAPGEFGPSAAYETLERGRGRAILDLLGRGGLGECAVALDLEGGVDDDGLHARLETIRQREVDARAREVELAAAIRSAEYDAALDAGQRRERIDALRAQYDRACDAERQAARELDELVCRHRTSSELKPMAPQQIAANMTPGELLLAYEVGARDSLVFALEPSGRVRAITLKWPGGSEVTEDMLAEAVTRILARQSRAEPPPSLAAGGGADDDDARDLARALLPDGLREDIRAATRVLVIPDGPLHQLPFELLALDAEDNRSWIEAGPPIVHGPSGTLIAMKRAWARDRRQRGDRQPAPALVALGDPVFAREPSNPHRRADAPEPDHGVLLACVTPGSNAARSGLRAGDVILTYDGIRVGGPNDLPATIRVARTAGRGIDVSTRGEGAKPGSEQHVGATRTSAPEGKASEDSTRGGVPVTVWRDGFTLTTTLAPGPLDAEFSKSSMPVALRDHRDAQLTEEQRFAKYASAATRGGFGTLQPLPGTRAEIDAIGALVGTTGTASDSVVVLAGEEATAARLFQAADSPRFLHLATHGLSKGGCRVHDSALALTVPREPTPEDFGFLRLQDLLYRWGGKLKGTELVVLSGCRTGRGRLEAADGFVGLPWGFLYAGADSVIASLWKVDDAATVLLMTRLYENLLGAYDESRGRFLPGTPMPKADALHEAKRWLRARSPQQNREMLTALSFDVDRWRRARGTLLPSEDPEPLSDPFDFSHPCYWAAFTLIGDPG